jgi:hypothetical protein
VASRFFYARNLVFASSIKCPRHGLWGARSRVFLTYHSSRKQLSSCNGVGCIKAWPSLCESIEVDTEFVKQYPCWHGVLGHDTSKSPAAWPAASQDLTRIESVAQAITDVVDRDHRQEDHQPREKRPMWREIEIISGI